MADNSAAQPDDLEALARSRFSNLSEAELRLVRSAPRGEIAFCGPSKGHKDLTNDPAKADRWSRGRELRAELIRWLCVDREAAKRIDPRGIHVYAGRITGKLDLSNMTVDFPLRFERCLLTDDADLQHVKIPDLRLTGSRTKSINADAADVAWEVSLGDGFLAGGEVRLIDAQIGTQLHCDGGTFKNQGRALSVDRLKVGGGIFLRNGFLAEGEVRFSDAQIGGSLSCTGSKFKNPTGPALTAERVKLGGSVFLTEGFRAEGTVSLIGSQIGGELSCIGGTFKNPGGTALGADGISVGASIFLREGLAEGEVRLPGAHVVTDLDCKGCKLKNRGGTSFNAEHVKVGGSVYMGNGFSAEGEVAISGAQIGGSLECQGGTFKNPGNFALSAESANVEGSVFLSGGLSAEGTVDLFGAQIGGSLICNGAMFSSIFLYAATVKGIFFWVNVQSAHSTRLDLTNASVGAIADDEPSWPGKGNLSLDGFSYVRIFGGPTDAQSRLKWLDRQKEFKPQPYRQLAKVLSESGDEEGAREVLFEMEHGRWAGNRRRVIRMSGTVLRDTIGYGIYPERAVWYLCGLTALGWMLYRRAARVGAMAPTEKEAYAEFHTTGRPPAHYPPFNALIYSLENCVPLVKLGQDDRWQPDPNPQNRVARTAPGLSFRKRLVNLRLLRLPARVTSPAALRWMRRIMIGLGWLLATFFVAAVTGIVKSGF